MRKALRSLAALALISVPSVAVLRGADLVANGGFETGTFSGWTQFGDTGFTSILTSAAHSGNVGAFFAPGSNGGIFQTLGTSANQQYQLSFWLANTAGDNAFQASWNGTPLLSFTNSAAFAYKQFTVNATATGATTDLRFTFRHTGFLGAFNFDDVSVTPAAAAVVPEPPTLWLLLIGSVAGLVSAVASNRRAPVAGAGCRTADVGRPLAT